MMEDDVIKKGMMTKRAQKKKSIGPVNYKDRVFILTTTKLSYYEGTLQQRGKIKESFGVDTITFVGPINDAALNRTSAFQIIHNDCYLYCCAKGKADRDEWIEAIKQACWNQSLQTRYHPNIYNNSKWQCCGRTDKNDKGCKSNEEDAKKFSKPLPVIPHKELNMLRIPTQMSPNLPEPPSNRHYSGGTVNIPVPARHAKSPNFADPSTQLHRNNVSRTQSHSSADIPPPVSRRQDVPSKSHTLETSHGHKQRDNLKFNPGKLPVLPDVPVAPYKQLRGTRGNVGHETNSSTNRSSHFNHYPDNDANEPQVQSYPQYPAMQAHQAVKILPTSYEHHALPAIPPPRQSLEENNQNAMLVIALYDFEPVEPEDIALTTGESYTVLDTSRPHWWRVRNKYGAEGYIPANYVREATSDGLETMSWFEKDLSRQRAEYLLKQDGKEGSFVVRNSSMPTVVYTLSVISKGGCINGPLIVKHYHIKQNEQGEFYLSEKHSLPTIVELINYHKHNAGGLVTRLRQAPQSLEHVEQTHLFSDSKWELDMNEIEAMKELGSGQFGVVRLGKIRGKKLVALKIMKDGTMEENSFIEEAEVMTKLNHKNLVTLYGVVTKQRPICIVTEYMEHGCLLNYIRENQRLVAHHDTLLDMCYQVCDGMKYLEGMNMIHRDLAARNCLVGSNMVIKVADFGLTRYVLDDEYTSSFGSKFPIKWAAPEVLNFTKFSSKSDVWAFGVLMWELFTGGRMPYRAFSNSEVVDRVAHGHRLERPDNCPHSVYNLMLQTWNMDAEKRPSFESLFVTFLDLIDTINASCTPEGMYDA